jgi:hypothetical protein
MKVISALVVGLFAFGALAADPPTYQISCGVKKFKTQGDYKVSASVKGDVTGRSGKPYSIDNYTVGYTVYQFDDTLWTQETITGGDLKAGPYDPKKYEGHVRFDLPSKRGTVELIYPESLEREKNFEAILMFTHIDEFGGRAVVHCSREKID